MYESEAGQNQEVNLPYISQFSRAQKSPETPRIAIFADVFFPLVNGVVFSIDGLCRELWITSFFVILVTPKMTRQRDPVYAYADVKTALPSFALPGRSGYRGIFPYLGSRALARLLPVDLIHSHSLFFAGALAQRAARKHRIPFVLTYHTMLEAYSHYAGPLAVWIAGWLRRHTRDFANSADVVTVATQATARYLRSIGVRTRIEVLPSGIDATALDHAVRDTELHRKHCGPAGGALVLCVARLGKEKNLELLLEAFSRVKVVATLVLAGDGPERAALERQAQCYGIASRVHFLGALDRDELAALYRSSDVFAFPSTSETQGLVVAEALYAELPVVVCDTPQMREVVRGSDARLVAAEPSAFAYSIEAAILQPCQVDQRASRKAAGAYFDRRSTSARMAELYGELLAR